ncbi:ABC transporter substrate-binding protein [Aurantimonas sp. VKM B-3413]|uniref:ABC transporter substrate-binding protein n=1 Tax=Aurantimonas sp. VKM B-3413 TaxID=2779401 RepID=UPI001E57C753|nr:ABC transporter substrate-binding protein [Aurantimonas sp. VKM B-3413]MCB8838593.1 ABC transporter substrate-binding protein [Aurantimonas sp. VKM B-3413]
MSAFDPFDRSGRLLGLNEVSRRKFLAGTAVFGLSAAFGTGIGLGSARAAEPKQGGHFKLGISGGSTTDTLDPAHYSDNYMQSIGHAIHNFLTEVNDEGQLVGELATKWEPSADASQWVFTLRDGVTFHDGKPVTADDVVASINHHRGEKSTSAAKVIVEPIKDIKADGKNKVVVQLDAGNADFPFLMSDYHLAIMPAKDGSADWESGIGCGAYVLDRLDPGVECHVTKNKNYWKSDRGWFDEVSFLSIKDAAARTNALMTGQIHAMNRVDLKTVNLLKRNPQIEIASIAGGQHYTAPMLTDVAPFDNNDVRMALKFGIDRQAMVDTILNGFGEVGNDQPINSTYRYFADLPQRTYDPDQAKHYLKKAGMDRLTVNLSAADAAFPGAVDAAVLFKEQAAKANIDINVVREPDDGYWDNVWMKKPFCMSYWGGKATADWAFSVGYSEGAAWNDTHWKNDRFNKLLVEARSELDEKKRAEMYAEMQRLVRDEGGVVLPMFANYVDGLRKNVGHGKIASNWDLDGLRAAERWWFTDV